MEGRKGGGQGSATLWLGTGSSLSLQRTGVIGFGASLHTLFLSPLFSPLFYPHVLALLLLPPTPFPIYKHTRSFFSTVIHAAHLQCFQERQIKRGFSYGSVTLELWAS